MKRSKILISSLLTLCVSAGTAFAEWTIQNTDDASYELVKACGSKTEAWSIAGGATKRLSIPAGATSCTITVKRTNTSCTVKDGEGCVIDGSGKIARR